MSIRSSSRPGIVSWPVLAVQMNRTRERSKRMVEVVVAKGRMLLRVEHLEHRGRRVAAEVGAHLVDLVDQEDGVRGLRVPDRADDRPRHGADSRRWPRISASSRTPPDEMRAKVRPSARAIDCPSDVFPTPGSPEQAEIRPERSFFSFGTARCSTIRSFTQSRSK